MQVTRNVQALLDVPDFTPQELAQLKKVHPSKIIRMFMDVEGVIRIGHGSGRGRRQYYTLRIPRHVAEREFEKLRVKRSA